MHALLHPLIVMVAHLPNPHSSSVLSITFDAQWSAVNMALPPGSPSKCLCSGKSPHLVVAVERCTFPNTFWSGCLIWYLVDGFLQLEFVSDVQKIPQYRFCSDSTICPVPGLLALGLRACPTFWCTIWRIVQLLMFGNGSPHGSRWVSYHLFVIAWVVFLLMMPLTVLAIGLWFVSVLVGCSIICFSVQLLF